MVDKVTVEMLKKTNTRFGRKNVGDKFDVDEKTAERWFECGIAVEVEEEQPVKVRALEDMSVSELREYARDNDIDLSGVPKKDRKDPAKVLDYILAFADDKQGSQPDGSEKDDDPEGNEGSE